MKITDVDTMVRLSDRFYSFNDGKVRHWCVNFADEGISVEVVIDARDRDSPTEWSRVKFRVEGCDVVRFVESSRASYQVLSNGLHCVFGRNCVGLEFGSFVDAPESIEVLQQSACCVVGRTLVCEHIASLDS